MSTPRQNNPQRTSSSRNDAPRAPRVKRPKQKNQNKGRQEDAPVSHGSKVVTQAPRITQSPKSIRIKQTELVGESIVGHTNFTNVLNLRINPGLSSVFPWLSQQAVGWEQYRIHSLCFRYVPFCSTLTSGEVYLIPGYDTSEPFVSDERSASANFGTVAGSCWMQLTLKMDVPAMHALGPRKFVRSTEVFGDSKTFDCCSIQLATVNSPTTIAWGKLFVDYDIEFFMPQSNPLAGLIPANSSWFQGVGTTPLAHIGTVFNVAWQPSGTTFSSDYLGWYQYYVPSTKEFGPGLPPGFYRIMVNFKYSVAAGSGLNYVSCRISNFDGSTLATDVTTVADHADAGYPKDGAICAFIYAQVTSATVIAIAGTNVGVSDCTVKADCVLSIELV